MCAEEKGAHYSINFQWENTKQIMGSGNKNEKFRLNMFKFVLRMCRQQKECCSCKQPGTSNQCRNFKDWFWCALTEFTKRASSWYWFLSLFRLIILFRACAIKKVSYISRAIQKLNELQLISCLMHETYVFKHFFLSDLNVMVKRKVSNTNMKKRAFVLCVFCFLFFGLSY